MQSFGRRTVSMGGRGPSPESLNFFLQFESRKLEREYVQTRVCENRPLMRMTLLVMILGSLSLFALSLVREQHDVHDSGKYGWPFVALGALSLLYVGVVQSRFAESCWQPFLFVYAAALAATLLVSYRMLPSGAESNDLRAFYAGVLSCAGPALTQLWMLNTIAYSLVLACFIGFYWTTGTVAADTGSVSDVPVTLLLFGVVMIAKTRRDELAARLEFLRTRRLRARGEDVRIKVQQFTVADLGAWLAGSRRSRNESGGHLVSGAGGGSSHLPLVHYDATDHPRQGPLGIGSYDGGAAGFDRKQRSLTDTQQGDDRAASRPSRVHSALSPLAQRTSSASASLLHARVPSLLDHAHDDAGSQQRKQNVLAAMFTRAEAAMASTVRRDSSARRGLRGVSGTTDSSRSTAAESAPVALRLWVISRKALHIARKIASGGSGQVWEGRYNRTRVAVKELFSALMDPEALDEFAQEASLLSQLRHPNIVLFYGIAASQRGGVPAMVTEFCPVPLSRMLSAAGSAHAAAGSKLPQEAAAAAAAAAGAAGASAPAQLSPAEGDDAALARLVASFDPSAVALDIAFGMQYLHERDVIHQDLKVENVLLDATGVAKICDFGISQLVDAAAEAAETLAVGTPEYMAPELWDESGIGTSKKVDVYAFGVLLLRLFTFGQDPYERFSKSADRAACIREYVLAGHRPEANPSVPHPVRKLALVCMDHLPHKRPSFSEIVQHLSSIRGGVE